MSPETGEGRNYRIIVWEKPRVGGKPGTIWHWTIRDRNGKELIPRPGLELTRRNAWRQAKKALKAIKKGPRELGYEEQWFE